MGIFAVILSAAVLSFGWNILPCGEDCSEGIPSEFTISGGQSGTYSAPGAETQDFTRFNTPCIFYGASTSQSMGGSLQSVVSILSGIPSPTPSRPSASKGRTLLKTGAPSGYVFILGNLRL